MQVRFGFRIADILARSERFVQTICLILAIVGGMWSFSAIATTNESKGKLKTVGILMLGEDRLSRTWHRGLVETLRARGWDSGTNLRIEHRYARGPQFSLDESARELVNLDVDVILAISKPAVAAAFRATRKIPIVGMEFSSDPVAAGYVDSYARPGKNLTGVFIGAPELASKWVEIMHALKPGVRHIAVLWSPDSGSLHLKAVQHAAASFKIRVSVLEVLTQVDIERHIRSLPNSTDALLVLPSPQILSESANIARLALQRRIPAISMFRAFVEQGGAVAYGPILLETVQRCAAKVASILEGARVNEMPVESPMRFDFIYNLKTLATLRLSPPDYFLLGAEALGK